MIAGKHDVSAATAASKAGWQQGRCADNAQQRGRPSVDLGTSLGAADKTGGDYSSQIEERSENVVLPCCLLASPRRVRQSTAVEQLLDFCIVSVSGHVSCPGGPRPVAPPSLIRPVNVAIKVASDRTIVILRPGAFPPTSARSQEPDLHVSGH